MYWFPFASKTLYDGLLNSTPIAVLLESPLYPALVLPATRFDVGTWSTAGACTAAASGIIIRNVANVMQARNIKLVPATDLLFIIRLRSRSSAAPFSWPSPCLKRHEKYRSALHPAQTHHPGPASQRRQIEGSVLYQDEVPGESALSIQAHVYNF
jgi:hypothetical protein